MHQLKLQIDKREEDDAEEMEDLSRSLRDDLSNLDVVKEVTLATENPPSGSKALDGVALGSMIVDFATGGAVKQVAETVQMWIKRNENRSIALEMDGDKIDVKGASGKDQQKIIDAWVMRQMQKMSATNG